MKNFNAIAVAVAVSMYAAIIFFPGMLRAQVAVGELPDKGSAAFQGTYNGTVEVNPSKRPQLRELSGALTIRMKVDGPAASAEITPTGNMSAFKVTGTKIGQTCRMFNREGDIFEGECNSAYFKGTLTSPNTSAKYRLNVRFDAVVLEIVDAVEAKRQADAKRAADEQLRSKEAVAQKRKDDEERARQEALIDSLPPVSKSK